MTGTSGPLRAGNGSNRPPGLHRLEEARLRATEQFRRARDVLELSEAQLDVLTFALIAEAVLLPLMFLRGTDIYLIVLYALVITAVFFVLFFAMNLVGEKLVRERGSMLKAVEAQLDAATVIYPKQPR